MDGSIRQILDPRVLTAAYAQVPAADATPFTDAFFVNPEQIDDDEFRSMYDPADLYPAPENETGGEARVLSIGGATERFFKMVFSFNKMKLDPIVLQALREPDSYTLQKMGRTEVQRLIRKFSRRQKRFKEVWIAKVLTKGVVYLDAQGRILESSSGAVKTVATQVAAGHQGTCGGLIGSGAWSNTGTGVSIPLDIDEIDDTAASEGKPVPTDCWAHKLNLNKVISTDEFKSWAQYNGEQANRVLFELRQKNSAEIRIDNLWGKTWHFINTYYTDTSGVNKPIIPKTGTGSAVLTPPPGGEWMKATNGQVLVPRQLGVGRSVEEVLANCDSVYGEFAYAKLNDDPLGIWAYMGDKFGFHLNEPDAIWQLDAFA